MKKVLALVKGNLLIVVVVGVAVIAIPVMLFFSARWNQQIRDQVSSDVSKTMSSINGLPVTYEIPGELTGGEAWQSPRVAPNPVLNQRMEAVLSRLSSESEAVRELAVRHNSAGKELLVDGEDVRDKLFPAPVDESARVRLLTELTRERPRAYARLLEEARAGMPPEADELERQLQARRARRVQEIIQGRVEQKLSEEEAEEIRRELSRERLEFYRQRASRIAVYAEPSVFVGVREWREDEGLPSLETAWEWQMEYWVAEDVVSAIASANLDPATGRWLAVPMAPVKRVLSIGVEPLSGAGGPGGRGFADEAPSVPTDPNAPIQPTFGMSFTGRAGYPSAPNALYDVRYATVELVVDVNRLKEVLEAFSTTNFMSVIDLDFEAIDPYEALEAGFVYGGDAVARARIRLETIWLRSWMKRWMPAGVRERLGIAVEPEGAGTGAEGEAGAEGEEWTP